MKKQIFKIEETEGKRLLKIVPHSYGVFLVFDDSFLNIHARHDYDGNIEYEFDDEINHIENIFNKESAIESTIVDSIEWDELGEWVEYQRLRAKYES